MHIVITGEIRLEHQGAVVRAEQLPGGQGRLLLARLVVEHERPVAREELAALLWGESPPATWDKALAVLVSKLRALLVTLGLPPDALTNAFGCYELRLPPDTWIDLHAIRPLLAQSRRAFEAGDLAGAQVAAFQAARLARESFLPGAQGAWVDSCREQRHQLLVASLDSLSDLDVALGDGAVAVEAAEESCALEPFSEAAHRGLMRAHAACGNRADAVRAYARCRSLLALELGIEPAAETRAVYADLFRGTSTALELECPACGCCMPPQGWHPEEPRTALV